jgi:hypothetical protein
VEGNFPGVAGDMSTLWKPGGGPHTLSQAMVDASMRILEDIISQTAIHHVYAHRQSSKNRRACPGDAIWSLIGRPYREMLACSELDMLQRFADKARTIPHQWDNAAKGEY